jgi:hypothetical protein
MSPNVTRAARSISMARARRRGRISAWSFASRERFDEAIAAFERAQAFHATTGEAPDEVVNFAICLLRAGRTGQALTLLERNLPHYPSATGHSQYALALLTSGRLVEGFDQYEFRWMEPPLSASRAKFAKPAWTGTGPARPDDPAARRAGLRRLHPVLPLRATCQGTGCDGARDRSATNCVSSPRHSTASTVC